MKVILDAQYAYCENNTGLHFAVSNIINALLSRNKFDYELTYFSKGLNFDIGGELQKNFGRYNVPIHECGEISYGYYAGNNDIFLTKSYNEYTGTNGDVYMFFHCYPCPFNIKGHVVVLIYDFFTYTIPECFEESYVKNRKRQIKYADFLRPDVAVISESCKNDALRFTNIPKEKIHNISLGNPVNNSDIPPRSVLADFGITNEFILFIGTVSPHKNLIRITDAFESAAVKNKTLMLVIAGNQNSGSTGILDKIKKSPFSSRILLTGYVTDEQRSALYHYALAFVFPSLYEGFGFPVLEAMSCGCPVITSNVSSMPEVAGDAAILADPYSTEQISNAIDSLANNPDLRNDLIKKGLAQKKKFTWEKTAENLEAVFEKAYSRKQVENNFSIIKADYNDKVIIAGLGKIFKYYIDFLSDICDIVALSDNYKKGQTIKGKTVISAEQIPETEYDFVIVTPASPFCEEITAQLINIGVPEHKILSISEFAELCTQRIFLRNE